MKHSKNNLDQLVAQKLSEVRALQNKLYKQRERAAQPRLQELIGKCFVTKTNRAHTKSGHRHFDVYYRVLKAEFNDNGSDNHHLTVQQVSREPAYYGGFNYNFSISNFHQCVIGQNPIPPAEFAKVYAKYVNDLLTKNPLKG